MDHRERTQKDENIISLILHTFRNLAAIQDRASTSESADAIEQSSLQVRLVRSRPLAKPIADD